MQRFAFYDETASISDAELRTAHLVGHRETVVKGSIKLDGDSIVCQSRGSQTVALCLLHDTGAMGKLMLQTCLLPDRDEPYVLSVELARHRIKLFITKSEEWQMFDLSPEHPAMANWEKARLLFTQAITSADPKAADRLATEALAYAIDATERLAMAHAEILLHRRFGNKAASSATLGVQVHPQRDAKPLREIIERDFDVVSIPLNWRELEVEEGKYNWGPVDRWMEWAQKTGKPIVAGPLLDFSKRAVPEWMYVWQHDYDTTRDLAYDHVERVVQRYASVVGLWNLASGLNTNTNFEFTLEQMFDLLRMVRLLVKQNRPKARTIVEIAQPLGEHLANKGESAPPLTFLERMTQEGIRVDAIGVQLLFGGIEQGTATRDLMQASDALDRFFFLEQPVIITALGAPSANANGGGGSWHGGWTSESQARWVGRMFALAMSKPFVETVIWTDLFDHDLSRLPNGGLIDAAGRAKPAMTRLINMRKRLRKPLGQLKLPPRGAGSKTAEAR